MTHLQIKIFAVGEHLLTLEIDNKSIKVFYIVILENSMNYDLDNIV